MEVSNQEKKSNPENQNGEANIVIEKTLNFDQEAINPRNENNSNLTERTDEAQNSGNAVQNSKPNMKINLSDILNQRDTAQKPMRDRIPMTSARKSPKRRFLNEGNQPKLSNDDKLIRYINSYAIGFADDNGQDRDYLDDYMMHLQTLYRDSEDLPENFDYYQELDSKCGNRIDRKLIEDFFVNKSVDKSALVKKLEEELYAEKNKSLNESIQEDSKSDLDIEERKKTD